jgi:NAD kinase
MVSGDEQLAVIPRAPRLGNMTAANSNGGGPIEIVITTAPSEDAWAKVDSIASHRAGQGAQVSIRHTDQTIRGLQRPKLMGR